MITRRQVLIGGTAMAAGITMFGCGHSTVIASPYSHKTKEPRRALVAWFSQTGHTERMGKIIADAWRRDGMEVESGDVRHIDPTALPSYDCIVAGGPVFYYDAPDYLRDWLWSIPRIEGLSVAAFSTYGGPGHNQHNTACTLLEILVEKGGVPAGLATFGNMSTFAPTWSALGRDARILTYGHLPDEHTFSRARHFAQEILERVTHGEAISVRRQFSFGSLVGSATATGLTKRLIGTHEIDPNICITCGICVDLCPPNVIDLDAYSIDRPGCVACMACINNCPVQAFHMTFLGRPVYGFNEFLRRQGIRIREPELLG